MDARRTKKEETVQRILDAALEIFSDVGFEGARMDRIAEKAGVNKAMIYYHIGDKKALYAQVLHHVFGDMTSRLANNISKVASPAENISVYIHSILETFEKHPFLPSIMMREMASGGSHLPDIVTEDMMSVIHMVVETIAEGQKQGRFSDIHPLFLHLMVVGGYAFFKAGNHVIQKALDRIEPHLSKMHKQPLLKPEDEILNIVLKAVSK